MRVSTECIRQAYAEHCKHSPTALAKVTYRIYLNLMRAFFPIKQVQKLHARWDRARP